MQIRLAPLAAIPILLIGCDGVAAVTGTGDNGADKACSAFAQDWERTDDRPALVREVASYVDDLDDADGDLGRIHDEATDGVLPRTADGNDGAWQMAADTFADACLDAGWGEE